MKQVQRKTLAAMLEDMGSLRVDSSFDWVLMDGVMLTKLQGSSYLNLIDEHVPPCQPYRPSMWMRTA